MNIIQWLTKFQKLLFKIDNLHFKLPKTKSFYYYSIDQFHKFIYAHYTVGAYLRERVFDRLVVVSYSRHGQVTLNDEVEVLTANNHEQFPKYNIGYTTRTEIPPSLNGVT